MTSDVADCGESIMFEEADNCPRAPPAYHDDHVYSRVEGTHVLSSGCAFIVVETGDVTEVGCNVREVTCCMIDVDCECDRLSDTVASHGSDSDDECEACDDHHLAWGPKQM